MEKDSFAAKQFLRIKDLEEKNAFGLVGTYLLDYNKKIVYGDRTLCKIYGLEYRKDGIPLDEFQSKISIEDLEAAKALREKHINDKQAYEIEYRVEIRPGEFSWVMAKARAEVVDGNILYEGIVIDITKRKDAEFALSQQTKLMQTITDNASSALFLMDAKGFCTFMNPAAEAMFGYSYEEIKARPLHDLVHHHYPDGREYPINECPLDAALRNNVELRAKEDLFFHKDGYPLFVRCAVSPVFENGLPVATVIEVQDITPQKNFEKILQEQAEHLSILNTVGQTISEDLDLQNILQKVTDATTKLTGAAFGAFFYNVIDARGESFMLYTLSGAPREAFDKFGMPRNTAVFHTTFSGEGVSRVDDIRKDRRYGKNSPHQGMPKGHLPVVSYLAVPVISKSGKVIGGLFFGHPEPAMFTQIHEDLVMGVASQAAIALDNAKLYEEVKLLNAKKDEFIGLASHELKTPLTSITGYLQLLQRSETSEVNKNFIKKTIEKVDKLTSLVNDLLDVSKIEAGKLQLHLENFDFKEVLNESIEIASYSNSTHLIHLNCCKDPLIIHADRQRIEQVLINLITNAIKYSPKANTVDIEVKRIGNELTVGVRDYGIGIAKEKQANIFSRFYRVEELNPNISGLGIGLYISKEIIDRHNGKIWVESEIGQGSVFYFTLSLIQS